MKKTVLLLMLAGLLCILTAGYAETEGSAAILYFDYSENIQTDGLDLDAISQASMAGDLVRERGNLLVMTDILAERTGLTPSAIHIVRVYAPEYEDMVMGAREDKENGAQFELTESLPDLSDVSRIYFGSPIWWYDMPQPVINFFEQTDLAGKEIVYFSINRGSDDDGVLERLSVLQPDAIVVDTFTIDAATGNQETVEAFGAFLDELGIRR